ncbi:timeless protein-domain-containing protein [Lasiosphaeria ovina]|uniref:Topoisomerase 1-associated factor 1 n=1 Tax=Lasiosphaeria ovina TaxID=92902 RepID=A0AAE0KCI7_9PEZI|nr:timeless protein-domain-containing protein [Lasiosphaeria ovina]
MEAAEVNTDTVHPEVRAHITSLVSALGGINVDDGDGDGYKLGDDALEVLRDLKKWIRFYDEKTNRMDVARCLAEANLIGGDLLQILASWPPNCADNAYRARIALACFEVMTPLTWPIEMDRDNMTVNHYRHIPVLQLAQLGYKRAIINFDAAPILSTAVRVALPSMALPIGQRTPRDHGIIKLILYFMRNIAAISPPQGLKYDGDETQISRSTLVDAFSFQDIFLTLLTVSSNMGDDFRTEDIIVLDTLFHLVKRVDSSKLFVSEREVNKAKSDELTAAMNKEAAMLRAYSKTAPTRHSRFGTMMWVKRENGKMATVTGQEALLDAATRERKMDSSKSFKPSRKAIKDGMEQKNLGPPATLDERARQQLGSFVSDFLDSGFNPLFLHVRKSIDRGALHVLDYHKDQFFYLTAWFLEAERMRIKSRKGSKKTPAADEVGTFNLVAEVLSQEMFITLMRHLNRAFGDHNWTLLTTVMRCFTQILLTVQDMADSGNEEDEEIADNTLSRLFYEETTHDAIANIVRTYKDQGFEYLDACTELAHTFLRILESYSKQNVDLQVRSRKRVRRKKKAAKAAEGEGEDGDGDQDEGDDDSANDEQRVEKTSQERKFDFRRFTTRFLPQAVVDTFVKFTSFYRDLNDSQLKRAHRYFYRVAFKLDMSVMIFRLDIIHLFYDMIKGPKPLDKSSSVYKDWEELTKQLIKKCVRKLEERPALFTELLFSKINSTAHYLEYGYEKQTISSNPRPGAELEFKGAVEHDRQVAIAVGVLLDKGQADHLEWMKKQLSEAEVDRRAWENAEKALAEAAGGTADENLGKAAPPITVVPDDDARRTARFKNPHLRLLMKLVGIERLTPTLDETPESSWVFPGSLTADALKDSLGLIKKAEFSPPTFEDDQMAEDQLRRKSALRKRAAYDDDDGMDDLIDDDEMLFPMGGPTARKQTAEDQRPKKRQKRQRRAGSEEADLPTEEQLDEKARARRLKQLEKRRKIKSTLYVESSGDEGKEERAAFFAREKARQQAKNETFGLATATDDAGKSAWDRIAGVDDSDEDAGPSQSTAPAKAKKKPTTMAALIASSDEDDDDDDDDDNDHSASSQASPPRRSQTKTKTTKPARRPALSSEEEDEGDNEQEDDDEDEENDDDDDMESSQTSQTARADSTPMLENDTGTRGTPLSLSPSGANGAGGNTQNSATSGARDRGDDDNDDDDLPAAAVSKARPRARAGFILDSSDEE